MMAANHCCCHQVNTWVVLSVYLVFPWREKVLGIPAIPIGVLPHVRGKEAFHPRKIYKDTVLGVCYISIGSVVYAACHPGNQEDKGFC